QRVGATRFGDRAGGGGFGGGLVPAARDEVEQGDAELDAEPEGHHGAGNVGQQPAGVAHDLQDGGAVVVGKAGLVEGQPAVTQRVVQVDEHLAVVLAVGRVDAHAAGEIL